MASIRLACEHGCDAIFLENDQCGRVQTTVGGAIPEQVALGCVRKEDEQAMENKLVSSIPPWHS